MRNLSTIVIVITVLAVFSGAIAVYQSARLGPQIDQNRSDSIAYTQLINLLAINQEMRRREKDFFLRKDMIYVKQYENLSGQALGHINDLKKIAFGKSQELAKLEELLSEHKKEFQFAVNAQEEIGFDSDKGIQGRMRDHIHALEDILVYKIKNDKLTLLLFTLRRNEKNFLLKMQSAPDQTTPDVAHDFEVYLKGMNIKPELKSSANKALSEYLREFKLLVAKETRLRNSVSTLSDIFSKVENLHFQLLRDARKSEEESYIAARRFIDTTRIVGFGAGLLAIATGIVAFVLARRRVLYP